MNKGGHRAPSKLPIAIAGTVVFALAGTLVAVIVHDAAENPRTVSSSAVTVTPPAVTKSVPATQKTDQVAVAHGLKPLAKLVKGNRVINEQDPSRPVCTFQLWGGSIDQAVIQCGGESRQLTIKTGYLTPVEVNR